MSLPGERRLNSIDTVDRLRLASGWAWALSDCERNLGSTHVTTDMDGGLCDGPDLDDFSIGLAMITAMLEKSRICFGGRGVLPLYLVAMHPPRVVLSPMWACLAGKRG